METWMFPVLTVLFPSFARAAAQYRVDRLPGSLRNGQLAGYDGAMWAWESAFTGEWTAPWRGADTNENHISADIPLAWRKFYYATGDEEFLSAIWPSLNETCIFWACRFQRTDSVGPAPAGSAVNCSGKDGVGNFTVHSIIPPDEASGVTNDSVYTNAAGAQTLAWCSEAAAILRYPVPALWQTISDSPYLPLNDHLYAAGPVHMQDATYHAQEINQADVALLQYPLGLVFDHDLMQRDLDYYATKTNFAGMFTGDSSYSCAYLALGNRSAADNQLALAFGHIDPHFNVFTETELTDGGHSQHFITGALGFVQGFVFGYSGLRIQRIGVLSFTALQPELPPLNVSAMKLRGLHLLGGAFDFMYNATTICAVLQPPAADAGPRTLPPLELRDVGSGARLPLTLQDTCVGLGPVEIAGVGYV